MLLIGTRPPSTDHRRRRRWQWCEGRRTARGQVASDGRSWIFPAPRGCQRRVTSPGVMRTQERSPSVTAPHGPTAILLAELPAPPSGLTTAEARRRLADAGPNEPARAPRTAGLVQILLLLANPLVIILLIASAASAILGEGINASIIVLVLILSVVLNFVRSEEHTSELQSRFGISYD